MVNNIFTFIGFLVVVGVISMSFAFLWIWCFTWYREYQDKKYSKKMTIWKTD
jgi:hypothetical protein